MVRRGESDPTPEPLPEPDSAGVWTWAESNWNALVARLVRYRQRLRFRRRLAGVLLRYMQSLQQLRPEHLPKRSDVGNGAPGYRRP